MRTAAVIGSDGVELRQLLGVPVSYDGNTRPPAGNDDFPTDRRLHRMAQRDHTARPFSNQPMNLIPRDKISLQHQAVHPCRSDRIADAHLNVSFPPLLMAGPHRAGWINEQRDGVRNELAF